MTRQALEREGAAMSHCVGDGDYRYLCGGEEITDDAIWSLRDAEGASRLTVQITDNDIDSAKGPHNHDPGKHAAMQVRHLVSAFKAAGKDLICRTKDIVLGPDGRTFRHDRVPADVQAAIDAARREAQEARERRMREAEERRATEPVYRLAPGQVMFRILDGQDRTWRQFGDVESFEIRTREAPLSPVLAMIPQIAFGMTFTPGANRIGRPPHPIFGMFEDLPNPLIAMWSQGNGTGMTLGLQDGQEIRLTADETAAIAVRGDSLIDPGGLLHGKVMALQPADDAAGSIRIQSLPEVRCAMVHLLAHGAKVAAVTAQGVDLVERDDFSVSPLSGRIAFHDDFRDVEILWESPRVPPAPRTIREAVLDRVRARLLVTVDETERSPWGSFALSADVASLRVGGTP
ncbi:hypothetical protein MKK55_07790 [Methylobacterium sp. J-059]|uniref:hypothetical protein n=1 Tax=Methylobacterium sp. J-059 TaxID=2836643 RepID=UPI001FB89768|nr:hypothetical protein [Methylobacterium sp. J-059]MCJ2038855.1 hypothetical protein [Methylobacterium sp. J-059]